MNNGAFGENFPYSNFHDLNMDWIVKIAKDFLDQYTHIQQIIEDGEQSLLDKTDSGLAQLQEKADALEELLNQWYTTHSNDIANQLAQALLDLNTWYTTHSNDIADQLAQALLDLNTWYTTHENYLDQTLASNIAEFNTRADAKATETIASIPSDYTDLFNTVNQTIDNLDDTLNPLSSIYPLIYGYMKTDNTIVDRRNVQDYKLKVFDVSQHKDIIINGTTVNESIYFCIMFLKDNKIDFNKTLNVSSIKAGLLNSEIDSSYTGNSVTYNNYVISIPSDCKYVIIEDYYDNLIITGSLDIFTSMIKSTPLPYTRFINRYYNISTNNLLEATGYEAKLYNVQGLERVYIKGSCRGGSSVCPACFLTDNLGTGVSIVGTSATITLSPNSISLDQYVEVPDNAKYLVVTSYTSDGDVMCVYKCDTIYNICTYKPRKINCIGDSLTMGAIGQGHDSLHPYSDTLQKLLGNGGNTYIVENNGIGGENTLDVASRLNGVCGITGAGIIIPPNRAWIDLPAIKSIYDDSLLTLLRQGTDLQGCHADGNQNYRSYYVYIQGIRMVLAYWAGTGYKLVRAENSLDNNSITIQAGEPIIFERTVNERDTLCNIIWTGINDSDRTELVEKIKAVLSYYNNTNYIVIGLHNYIAGIFTDNMRTEYRKAFGVRFFDLDKYTRTDALSDCGITPTSADTTAINNGLCPPSLLSDNVHFTSTMYDAIARKLYDKLKQINAIEY